MTISQIQSFVLLGTNIVLFIGVVIGLFVQVRTQINVRKIEIATNSMKDALVAATDKAAGLAGEARGRAQQKRDDNA